MTVMTLITSLISFIVLQILQQLMKTIIHIQILKTAFSQRRLMISANSLNLTKETKKKRRKKDNVTHKKSCSLFTICWFLLVFSKRSRKRKRKTATSPSDMQPEVLMKYYDVSLLLFFRLKRSLKKQMKRICKRTFQKQLNCWKKSYKWLRGYMILFIYS